MNKKMNLTTTIKKGFWWCRRWWLLYEL